MDSKHCFIRKKNWRIRTKYGEGMQSQCNAGVSWKSIQNWQAVSVIVASHFDARKSRIQKKQMEGNNLCVQRQMKAFKYCQNATIGKAHKRILQSVLLLHQLTLLPRKVITSIIILTRNYKVCKHELEESIPRSWETINLAKVTQWLYMHVFRCKLWQLFCHFVVLSYGCRSWGKHGVLISWLLSGFVYPTNKFLVLSQK